jgi:hypothetical protein
VTVPGTSAIHTALLLAALATPAVAADAVPVEAAGLRFVVPKDWERVHPTSPVLAAQFRLPPAGRKLDAGELLLVRIEAPHVDLVRTWYAEFGYADARPAPTRRTVHGLTVETVDVQGTYTPAMGPMPRVPRPGWRLLGAVVRGQGPPWYVHAVGPAATIEKARAGFDALIESVEAAR